MQNYRDILYKDYFSTQLGRGMQSHVEEKFNLEKEQFLIEVIPLLPSNKNLKILDIGCGTGSLIAALKESGYANCIGIDLSKEQIEVAHKNGIEEAQLGDLVPFLKNNKESFDVILGMDIIEHFTKDELCEVLNNIKFALKANGQVLFRTPNADAFLSGIYCKGDFTHETLLNYNSAEQLFMALGYQDIKIESAKIKTKPFIKELIRKVFWWAYTCRMKFMLFASGRSSKKVIFTPNLIIQATI